MTTAHRQRWYRGARGEWLVVVQMLLSAVVVFGPRALGGQRAWPFPDGNACLALGSVLLLAGALLFAAGLFRLGRGLTVLPCPKEGAVLVQSGAYALVRHPMYSGLLAMSFGWALWVQSGCTLAYAVLLFVFLDLKSRREERWLAERFPTYPDYRRRVRRFVPFVY